MSYSHHQGAGDLAEPPRASAFSPVVANSESQSSLAAEEEMPWQQPETGLYRTSESMSPSAEHRTGPTATSQTPSSAGYPKRNQVKNACISCQRACKKCDNARPCDRCVKYGIADSCADSVRKERKKGMALQKYSSNLPAERN
ncbi:hypothetical protein DFJ73DRAFT_367796 [Zopfochytrium polystomum]|nr:hypothetical protein DFJ73DRAFT_367796 [Zopfochytrium polystomum]